jgi:N-acetylneuraminate synthase/N,N'-diacetyllegionaminate synthase
MYPIPFSEANLNVMKTFKDATGLTIGYSDHTEGSKALETAVAMGAEILEFHFTDKREGKSFRDHKVSLTKAEVAELIKSIRDIENLKGSFIKEPVKSEIDNNHINSFRRAVYLKKTLKAGETINEADLVTLRPNNGIDARDFDKIKGKTLLKDIDAYHRLEWNMFTEI